MPEPATIEKNETLTTENGVHETAGPNGTNGATVGNLQKIVLADGKELTAAGGGGAPQQPTAPAQ